MEYSELIARIVAVIKENGNKEITGDQLQGVLFDMVGNLGSGYQFGGIVTPLSNPGRPDAKMLYLAFEEGGYEHLGGLTLNEGMGIFTFDSAWHLEVIEYTEREYIERAFEERVNKTTAQAEVDLKADELTPVVPPMVTGSARGILGRSAAARFLYRQTSSGSGAAWLRSIHGRTVSYNQLVQNGDFSDGTTGWRGQYGTISASNNTCTYIMSQSASSARIEAYMNFVGGHKYYIAFVGNPIKNTMLNIRIQNTTGDAQTSAPANAWTKCAIVLTAAADGGALYLYCNYNLSFAVGDTCRYRAAVVVDLTQAGLDSIITTPAEFEAWQMEQFGHTGYLGYTPGKLVSVNPTGVLTTGRNVWDEDWESGSISIITGGNEIDPFIIRSKNYIRVFGGETYFFKIGNKVLQLFQYDENKNFLTGWNWGNNYKGFATSAEWSLLPACSYIRIRILNSTTYNHDICISISGPRNGQYEPYNGHTLPLDFTEHFPTGMNGVNGIYDEVVSDENGKFTDGEKRFGIVDLGTLNWAYHAATGAFFVAIRIAGMKAMAVSACSKYPTKTTSPGGTNDGELSTQTYFGAGQPFVKDSSFGTDAVAFKAAMNGVPLVFELATPQHVTFTDPLDAVYPVTEGGTEQVQPVNGKVPTTISPDMILQMPRILGKDTPTIGSLDNLVAAVAQKIGRTITKEWDNETHSYQFEIQ